MKEIDILSNGMKYIHEILLYSSCMHDENIFDKQFEQYNTINTLLNIYMFYQKQKIALSYIDFSDITYISLKLLQSSHSLKVLYEFGINHLLIDESQDNSKLQWDILSSLCDHFFDQFENASNTLFVAGDVKQSIYSFQGANYKLFTHYKMYFENQSKFFKYKNVLLVKSYRSYQTIIDFVNLIFKTNDEIGCEYKEHKTIHKEKYGIVEIWPMISIKNEKK